MDWKLFLLASTGFWTVPFLFIGVNLEVALVVFSGAIAAKWMIFAMIDFTKSHPEKAISLHEVMSR